MSLQLFPPPQYLQVFKGRLCWFFIWLLEFTTEAHLALQLSVLWHFYFYYWFNLFTNYWSVMEILLKTQGVAEEVVGPVRLQPPELGRPGLCFSPSPPPLLGRSALLLQPVSPQTSGSQASSEGFIHPVSDTQMEKSQVSWCAVQRHFCQLCMSWFVTSKRREGSTCAIMMLASLLQGYLEGTPFWRLQHKLSEKNRKMDREQI